MLNENIYFFIINSHRSPRFTDLQAYKKPQGEKPKTSKGEPSLRNPMLAHVIARKTPFSELIVLQRSPPWEAFYTYIRTFSHTLAHSGSHTCTVGVCVSKQVRT